MLNRACLSSPISFSGAVELSKAGIVGISLTGPWSYWGMLDTTRTANYTRATFFFFKKKLKVI